MQFGVFSDVHDNLGNLRALLKSFEEHSVDTLLFLGDFCSPIPARLMNDYPGTIHCVFGNGDGDRFAIQKLSLSGQSSLVLHGEHAELELGERKIALTHYPLYGQALARTGDYAAVFYGHTHQQSAQRFGNCLLLNPGDILGLNSAPSYALYDATENDAVIHSLGGE